MKICLEEATESNFILKNPARKAQIPTCKESKETRPMSEEEVRRLFIVTSGRENLMWRIMCLCGLRLGECLALRGADITPFGLLVDESAYNGKGARTKNGKSRLVPLPEQLSPRSDGLGGGPS